MADFARSLALRGAGQIAQVAVQPASVTPVALPLVGPGQITTNTQGSQRARSMVHDQPLEAASVSEVAVTAASDPPDREPAGLQPSSLARIGESGLASAQAEPRTSLEPAPAAQAQALQGANAGGSSAVGAQTPPQTVAAPAARPADILLVPPELALRAPGVRRPEPPREDALSGRQLATAARPVEEAAARQRPGFSRDEMAEPQPVAAPPLVMVQAQDRAAPISAPAATDMGAPDVTEARSPALPGASAMARPAPPRVVTLVQPAPAPARNAALPAALRPAAASPTIAVRIGAVEVRAVQAEPTALPPLPAARPAPQPQGFAEYAHLRG